MTDLIDEVRAMYQQQIADERAGTSAGSESAEAWKFELEVERRVNLYIGHLEDRELERWQEWTEQGDLAEECNEECDGIADADGYDFISEEDIPY